MTLLAFLLGQGRSPARSLIFGRVSGAVAATAWLLLCARTLTPLEFGRFSLVAAGGVVVGVLAEGGVPVLVAHEVAAGSLPRVVTRRYLAARIPATGGLCAVFVLTALGVGGSPLFSAAVWYAVAIMSGAVVTTIGPGLRSAGYPALEGALEFGSRLLLLPIGFLVLQFWSSPTGVAATYAVAGSLTAGTALVLARRRFPASALDRGENIPIDLWRSMRLGRTAVLVTLYNRADLWLIAALLSTSAAGRYSGVYRVLEGMTLPATAFGSVLVAAASRPEATPQVPRQLIRRAAMTTLGLALVVVIAADVIVNAALGSAFRSEVSTLRVLAIGAVPTAIVAAASPLASLRDRHAGSGWVMIALATNVVANLLLVPSLGTIGGALALVASNSVLALLLWNALRRSGRFLSGGASFDK